MRVIHFYRWCKVKVQKGYIIFLQSSLRNGDHSLFKATHGQVTVCAYLIGSYTIYITYWSIVHNYEKSCNNPQHNWKLHICRFLFQTCQTVLGCCGDLRNRTGHILCHCFYCLFLFLAQTSEWTWIKQHYKLLVYI